MLYATSQDELENTHSDSGKVVPELEGWTGADLMLSPLSLPLTLTLLPDHISSGACLIQVKRGHDLCASIQDRRLHKSLSKMRSLSTRTAQCILLFVGILQDVDGEAHINRQPTHMHGKSFWSIQSAIDGWTEHGGIYAHLSKQSLIPTWLKKKEERLINYLSNPTREIIHYTKVYEIEPDDPLQEVVEVRDWRKTLVTFPRMGPTRVGKLLSTMNERGAYPSLLNALCWMTDRESCVSVPGFGEAIWKESRAWLGLDEGYRIGIDFYDNIKGEKS